MAALEAERLAATSVKSMDASAVEPRRKQTGILGGGVRCSPLHRGAVRVVVRTRPRLAHTTPPPPPMQSNLAAHTSRPPNVSYNYVRDVRISGDRPTRFIT